MKKTGLKIGGYLLLAIMLLEMLQIPVFATEDIFITDDWKNWPGEQDVYPCDTVLAGYSNVSGLDFYNGRLCAVDNGTGRLWIMEAFPDGTVRMTDGFQNGKKIQFTDRKSDMGPDVEGVTINEDGEVFLAIERDNEKPWISLNAVLKVDPWCDGNILPVTQLWDLTNLLPVCSINKGIESVEWASNEDMSGHLPDQNLGGLYQSENYPNAISGGVFFLGLEMNDHIYACVLNNDGSVNLIAEFAPGLTGISALDYDAATDMLWASSDDRGENRLLKLQFSEGELVTEYVLPPTGLNSEHNHEGFAIADESFAVDDRRPVYWLRDGVSSEALHIGFQEYHVHQFSEVWVSDKKEHWQECNCGERLNSEEHHFANVITAAAQKDAASRDHTAEYYQSCLICGMADHLHTFFAGQSMDPKHLTTPVAIQIFGIPQL